MTTILMVGTRKGLWIGRSEAHTEWTFTGPHQDMEEVYSCLVDTRGAVPRLYSGASSMWLGPQLRWSDDLGETWQETPNGAIRFPEGTRTSVERIWQIVPGVGEDELHAGTEPGAIFTSTDRGATFRLQEGLWNHPQRAEWGAGFGGQAFHTVLPHPTDTDSITAAISTGGVYRTTDGGGSWEPRNHGIRADFLPEGQQYPEFGQCVHKVTRHPQRPERLYLQNHGGVYRSDDEGGSWTSIGADLPSDFGFPIVVHPHRPDTIWVFPNGAGESRHPPGAQARVWRSDDAGDSWTAYDDGLPGHFYVGVMRDAMCVEPSDPAALYFGARNGTVWASYDDGQAWRQIIADLPDVMCVKVGVV